MGALLLAGALLWYRPWLTAPSQTYAEVPAPSALDVLTPFTLPAHGDACMDQVAITPSSALVQFTVDPAPGSRRGGPPLDFTVQGSGYRQTVHLAGGYPGGIATLPITPPRRALITTACFLNRGSRPATLIGTQEPRTVSRSHLQIDGRSQVGDISFSFLQSRPQDVLEQLGSVMQHASNLTDNLVPPAVLWIIAILAAFGVPLAFILAFRAAGLEDEPRA